MAMLNRVHLNGLRAVETVARLGSLSAAASELNVSASAVSQQVKRTEAQLGQALFERTASGLVPTEFGTVFTARLGAGFRELAQAVALADEASECTLVVSVAPAFASKWLLPRLSRHFARHPNVLLRIDASVRIADLDRSDIDIAIRLGDGKWPGVRAQLLLAQEDLPGLRPGDRRQTEIDRRSRPDLRDHRRKSDDQLGKLVRGGRGEAGHLPQGRALHRSDALPGIRRSPATA